MTESWGRWAALCNTMQFTDHLQRDVPGPGPASYSTTGVYNSFEHIVRARGRSLTFSFLLCSLLAMLWACFKWPTLISPCSREWEVAVGRYRALFAAFGM